MGINFPHQRDWVGAEAEILVSLPRDPAAEKSTQLDSRAWNISKAQSHDTGSPPEDVLLTRDFDLSPPSPIGGLTNDRKKEVPLVKPHTTHERADNVSQGHFCSHAL